MMHNEKDKQSQGHTECYKRSNERSQMITSDFESKVSSMKDVLLDVALKELINTISCQWLKIIQIEITEKKNNLQKQEDIWHIQEMVYTPIKTSGQEFKNRVRTCSRGEEECRGLCQDT